MNIDFVNVQLCITDLTILYYESYVPFGFLFLFLNL